MRFQRALHFAAALAALGLLSPALRAQVPVPQGIEAIADVDYKTVDGEKLTFDLFRATARGDIRPPVLLYFNGGGYRESDTEEFMTSDFLRRTFGPLIAANQLVVASVDVRDASRQEKLPLLVEDAMDALDYIRRNAAGLGGDPSRVGVMGYSSGAHLALMAGLARKEDFATGPVPGNPTGTRFIVVLAPLTDFKRWAEESAGSRDRELRKHLSNLRRGLGGTVEEIPAEYARVSPINYLHKDSPPILMLTGSDDPGYEHSGWLSTVAKTNESRLRWLTVRGAGHDLLEGNPSQKPSQEMLSNLLKSYISSNFN